MSGLPKERVLGRHFCSDVAPCTNNDLVAQRFEDANELDEVVPDVSTVRMKLRFVELRPLKSERATQYLLVRDRR